MQPKDEIEERNDSCPDCGNEMSWEDCWACGGEGGTDGEELMMEDPLWYDPSDFRRCDICEGKGGYYVCPNYQKHGNKKTH